MLREKYSFFDVIVTSSCLWDFMIVSKWFLAQLEVQFSIIITFFSETKCLFLKVLYALAILHHYRILKSKG